MAEVRLRRSRQQKMVGGVIGGVAEYFDRDPAFLRLLYIVISIVSAAFPGIFVYLILWALIPAAPEAPKASSVAAPAGGVPIVAP